MSKEEDERLLDLYPSVKDYWKEVGRREERAAWLNKIIEMQKVIPDYVLEELKRKMLQDWIDT